MAPGLTVSLPVRQASHEEPNKSHNDGIYPKPLNLTGVLERFEYEETTPVIGREYPTLNIVDDLLNAANADELIRDLAITSSSFNLYVYYYSWTKESH